MFSSPSELPVGASLPPKNSCGGKIRFNHLQDDDALFNARSRVTESNLGQSLTSWEEGWRSQGKMSGTECSLGWGSAVEEQGAGTGAY